VKFTGTNSPIGLIILIAYIRFIRFTLVPPLAAREEELRNVGDARSRYFKKK
jgi:hypothetical protein